MVLLIILSFNPEKNPLILYSLQILLTHWKTERGITFLLVYCIVFTTSMGVIRIVAISEEKKPVNKV